MRRFRKRSTTAPIQKKIRIGICAAEHNAGATTLSLSIASYLCSKRRKQTAYIEINGTDEISSLAKATGDPFRHYGVMIFPNVNFAELPEILTRSFECYILDFGPLHPNNYREFVQSDLGLVIGSIAPWKQARYNRFLQKYFPNNTDSPGHIRYLAALGIKEEEKAFAHRYHIPVSAFPYLEQPFQLSSADWQFLQSLLEDMGF